MKFQKGVPIPKRIDAALHELSQQNLFPVTA